MGGALWWSNKSEAAKAAKPPADTSPKILSLKEDDIRQIEIKKRDGTDTIVRKDDAGKWSITSPQPLGADQASANAVASAAASISAERVVDEHPADVPSYGLAPAADE